jgi:hypothetical protein
MLQESKIKFWGDKTTTETSEQTECAQIKWFDLWGKIQENKRRTMLERSKWFMTQRNCPGIRVFGRRPTKLLISGQCSWQACRTQRPNSS